MKIKNLIKLIKIVIICLSVIPFFALPGLSAESDINGDCVSDLGDAITALKLIAGTEENLSIRSDIALSFMDINGDGRIGIEQAVFILKKLADGTPASEIVANNQCPQHHEFDMAGGIDRVTFQASAGEDYRIEIRNPGNYCNAKLEIYDTDGTSLLTSLDGSGLGTEQTLQYRFEKDGKYSLKISNAESNASGEAAGYDLFLKTYENDDTLEKASLILSDETQHHRFYNAADSDWIMFYATAGKHYTIEAKNTGAGCNVKIELYGTDGNGPTETVNYNGKGEGETLNWIGCNQDGVYYVRVSHDNRDGFGADTGYDLEMKINAAPFAFGAIVGYVFALPSYTSGTIQNVTIICKDDKLTYHPLYNESRGIFYVYGLEKGTYTLIAAAPGYAETILGVDVGVKTVRRDIVIKLP